MAIIVSIIAVIVAAGCFVAILVTDLKQNTAAEVSKPTEKDNV